VQGVLVNGQVRRTALAPEQHAPLIGARLRAARQAGGLTLASVADAVGITKGFLSRLERDEVSPSVASLVAVCGALGLRVGDLFETPQTSLVRVGEAAAINFGGTDVHEVLLTPGTQRQLQAIHPYIAPGGGGGEELYSLDCEVELVFVLAGELRLDLAGETVRLFRGDAFTMPGQVPHTWSNPSATDSCEVLWVLVPAP